MQYICLSQASTEESVQELDSEYTAALQLATATDIQDIADILGVTFQEHCKATQLKVRDFLLHRISI